jgi:hypothetical protein
LRRFAAPWRASATCEPKQLCTDEDNSHTKIAINLILHLVILGVSLELVLGAIGERCLLLRAAHALQVAVHAVIAGGRVPSCFSGSVTLFALLAVSLHAVMRQLQAGGGAELASNLHFAVAFLTARVRSEGVRDVHGEHGLVEGCDVVSFCID